jgi:hypothetical protein
LVSFVVVDIGYWQGHFYPGEFWAGEGDRNAGEFGFGTWHTPMQLHISFRI